MGKSLLIKNKNKVKNANILAVVFDFDDTLASPSIEWQQVMAEFFVDNIHGKHLREVEKSKEVIRHKEYIVNNAGSTLTFYMKVLQQLIKKRKTLKIQSVDYYRNKFDLLWKNKTINHYTSKDLVRGIPTLLLKLKKHGIKIFVVTGGDRIHKVNLIKKLNLGGMIPSKNIFGDYDKRFPSGFSKISALQYIRDSVAKEAKLNINFDSSIICMIGDGKKDMQSAQKVRNVLAVGFNQEQNADIFISSEEYPVDDLLNILLNKNISI